jgi:hypothetical protein
MQRASSRDDMVTVMLLKRIKNFSCLTSECGQLGFDAGRDFREGW